MTSKRKAIVNGLVMTMAGGSLERGTVLIEGAQIVAVGTDVDLPADVDVIDAAGKVVMPGLIDAHSHVGLSAEGFGYDLADVNETSDPITPEVRALDALDPGSPAFEELLAAGVTTVLTGPGSANLIGGQWVCVKTVPKATVEDMVLLEPAGMKMALGENPKRVYGGRRKAPASRMGNAAVLRAALVDAQNYMLRWQRYEEEMARYQRKVEAGDQDAKKPTRPARDLKMEALVPVLKREMKARIHAHQANDILTAIRIAEEFDLDVTLEHVTEGYKIADLLAEKGLPVTVGPIFTGRKKYELRAKDHKNPGILANHGVKVAIQTDAASAVQYLAINAALAAREGMDETDALKAVTINAAEIIGVAERVGSLEVGKDADIVIFSGHPLEYRTVAEVVLVDGDVVYEREEA
jgi:imidazolonepropionase-like amidohydrolase